MQARPHPLPTSTHLELMDGDAQSEDPGKNGPGDLGVIAPEDPGQWKHCLGLRSLRRCHLPSWHQRRPVECRPYPVPPQSMPPPVTSGQPEPIRCSSCHQRNVSFKIWGPKILKTEIGATRVPGRRWQEGPWMGPLAWGSTPPPPDENDTTVTDATTPVTSGGRGTCRAPGK
jgi:hypothetical protein